MRKLVNRLSALAVMAACVCGTSLYHYNYLFGAAGPHGPFRFLGG